MAARILPPLCPSELEVPCPLLSSWQLPVPGSVGKM